MSTIERAAPPRVGLGVGASATRADGVPKVKGAFEYASDLHAEGMLHGHTTRSPKPHARIVAIDLSAALAAPGVAAAMTMADVTGKRTFGLEFSDQPVLADGVVRHVGEPVAIVAAGTEEQARRAAALVRVDYDDLPPVTDMERALDADAPAIHPFGNVLRHVHVVHGSPHVEGEVAVTGYYETAMQDNAPLGPEGALAIPAADGGVDLFVNTQWLHVDRQQIAPCLGLPESKVRITLAGMGGAFGAREDIHLQLHACMLALRTGRPVRMTYGREESFFAHKKRHPARMWMRHTASRDGRLVSVDARMVIDGGAYASSSPAVIANATTFLTGPYEVPNARLEGTAVYTNNPPCGAMRGFGAPQACFAHEAQMDKLAAALGMDGVELRLRNAVGTGSVLPTGQVIRGTAPGRDVLERCAAIQLPPERPAVAADQDGEWDPVDLPGGAGNVGRGEAIRRGVGFAFGYKNLAYSEGFDDASEARVTLSRGAGGRPLVTVHTAAVECGQGLETVLAQIVRSELAVDDVVVRRPDTAVGSAGSSSASRQTMISGGAVHLACGAARTALFERLRAEERAAGLDDDDALTVDAGWVMRHGLPVAEIADLLDEPIVRAETYHHRRTTGFDDRGQGDIHVAFAFAAERAVVDVDTELGLVKVVQIAAAQDVGRALNPALVHGQIEGATAMGMGLALTEEVLLRDGRILNPSFTDYLISTALDAPPLVAELVEEPEPGVPYGAKGVGEPATIVATAAIVAALRDATGRELNRAPVRPDDLVGLREPARSSGPAPLPPPPWQTPVPELHGFGLGQQELMKERSAGEG
jgi:xanthine dehydrogenase D subunit